MGSCFRLSLMIVCIPNIICWLAISFAKLEKVKQDTQQLKNNPQGLLLEAPHSPRIVLSAYGLEHEEILSIAKPLLSDLPAVSHPTKPKSVYIAFPTGLQLI
ncbi:hypothetical protein MKW98_004940 [Papaver atlanticum]|uniref:Uncharacterized protein n=1 Tax=Papaver atlanticum TaxID=357466 RepID=A0AAD4XF59_9MAGN|nr:hypothetical protein MKW98_004940 [Papaver atlanticum]